MSALQIGGWFFIGFVVVTLTAVSIAFIRWIRDSNGQAGSSFDELLRSGRLNPNSPDVAPTYTTSTELHGKGRIVQRKILDDPETQLRKHKNAQTTTTKELRAIE
jgi:hypothetical protein